MIYIITACSRPENLHLIHKTIPDDAQWVVVYDDKVSVPQLANTTLLKCESTGLVGVKAQNFALDNLPLNDNDCVLLHDDDNLIHPNLFPTILPLLSEDFSMITWGQVERNGKIRLRPTTRPMVGNIDTASFLVSWKYNKHIRHRVDVYEHDGIYAYECSQNGSLICLDDYLCYYNYLR